MNTRSFQVCEPSLMKPCDVCETDVAATSLRIWIFVPTTIELLHICLWCGNTLRQKRLE